MKWITRSPPRRATEESDRTVMLYFLDASAIVKLLFEEKDEKGATKVKELCKSSHPKRTTWLCVAEAYGCLKTFWLNNRKPKRDNLKQLNQRQYDRKLFHMQKYVQQRIKIVTEEWMSLQPQAFREIRDLLKKYPRIDFSDALHIDVLKRHRSLNPVFVTSDKPLISAARYETLVVWNPESDDSYPQ